MTWVPALVASGIVTVLADQPVNMVLVTSLSHAGMNTTVGHDRTSSQNWAAAAMFGSDVIACVARGACAENPGCVAWRV